jgi:NADH:ubiquinone oxidoreductase subunit H
LLINLTWKFFLPIALVNIFVLIPLLYIYYIMSRS